MLNVPELQEHLPGSGREAKKTAKQNKSVHIKACDAVFVQLVTQSTNRNTK